MGHVVLLGDSIFDNAAYVGGAPDVARQLTAELGDGWAVSLRARDGDTVADVESQLRRLPPDVTHLVVSAGGNDALRQSAVLAERAASVGDAVARLAGVRAGFERQYGAMLDRVSQLDLPVAVCTIYDANYPDPYGAVVRAALALFNDAITRAAAARRLALIDLRLVCSQPGDYANPIEPSAEGGLKIASAIAAFLRSEPGRGSCIWW